MLKYIFQLDQQHAIRLQFHLCIANFDKYKKYHTDLKMRINTQSQNKNRVKSRKGIIKENLMEVY